MVATRWRRIPVLVVLRLVVLMLLAGCTPADAWPSDDPSPTVALGRWTKLPDSPLSPRHDAVGAWVGGRFIVVGGRTDPPCPPNAGCVGPTTPAERDGASFDASTGEWQPIAASPTPVAAGYVVVAGDAVYVLVEGSDQEPRAFVRYVPVADRWDRLPVPTREWRSLVAAGDSVLAVAGSDEDRAAVDLAFDPESDTWRELPDDPLGPSFDREGTWVDGRLLLAAKDLVENPGSEKPSVVRLSWWHPTSDTWSRPSDTELIGWGPKAAGQRVVWPEAGSADGGEIGTWGRPYALGGIYDPVGDAWSELPTLPDRDGLVASGLVVGSRIVVGPGLEHRRTHRQGGHLLDPASGAWTELSPLPGADRSQQVTVASEDLIFVWGGGTAHGNLADGYLLRP